MTAEQYEKMIKEQFGWDHYVEFQKVQLEFERVLLPDPSPEFVAAQAAKQKPLDEKWKADVEAKMKELTKPGQPPPRQNDPAVVSQLPPHPIAEADLSWIPATTWELMDPRFVKSIQDNYAAGHEMHPLIRQSVVMTMRANLLKTSNVAPAPDEDPENFIFVGDEPVKLKEILALVSVRADDAVRRNALRELVNLRAADKRLDAEHAQETRAQSDEALQAVEKQYENSIIPLAQAVRLYGFNSTWHYRPFFARKHAYKTFLAKSTSEENLRAHYDEDGRLFFESGTVLAQALFVPGTDRASSKAAMDALFAEIVAGRPVDLTDSFRNKLPDGRGQAGQHRFGADRCGSRERATAARRTVAADRGTRHLQRGRLDVPGVARLLAEPHRLARAPRRALLHDRPAPGVREGARERPRGPRRPHLPALGERVAREARHPVPQKGLSREVVKESG
jgi:hypothetical protein